ERAHPQLLGPGQGLAVAALGRLGVRRLATRGDLGQEAEDPRLVAALLLAVGEVEGAPGDGERVVRTAGQEGRLPEVGQAARRAGGCASRGEARGRGGGGVPVDAGSASPPWRRPPPGGGRPDSTYAYPRCPAVMSK